MTTFLEKAREAASNIPFVQYGEHGHEVREDWFSAYQQVTNQDQADAVLDEIGITVYRDTDDFSNEGQIETLMYFRDMEGDDEPLERVDHPSDLIAYAREAVYREEQSTLSRASEAAILEKMPELEETFTTYVTHNHISANELQEMNRMLDDNNQDEFFTEVTEFHRDFIAMLEHVGERLHQAVEASEIESFFQVNASHVIR